LKHIIEIAKMASIKLDVILVKKVASGGCKKVLVSVLIGISRKLWILRKKGEAFLNKAVDSVLGMLPTIKIMNRKTS